MPIASTKNQVRAPLVLMAAVELTILFSSVYVAGIIVLGSVAECERMLGPLAPKAALVSVVALASLVTMGLYQFHQRLYFDEAAVRLLVGLALACLGLAILFYAVPQLMISRRIAAVAIAYSLILCCSFVTYLCARSTSTCSVDRHWSMAPVLGPGVSRRFAGAPTGADSKSLAA